eukprot:1545272-Amphidinium_carterae.2
MVWDTKHHTSRIYFRRYMNLPTQNLHNTRNHTSAFRLVTWVIDHLSRYIHTRNDADCLSWVIFGRLGKNRIYLLATPSKDVSRRNTNLSTLSTSPRHVVPWTDFEGAC